MRYKDQVVLVTGTSRGLGKSLALYFLKHQAKVIGISRSPAAWVEELSHVHVTKDPQIAAAAGATELGARYRHFQGDVGDEASVTSIFSLIRENYGSVDILINNAGIATSQLVALMPGAAAEAMLKTNFLGAFLVSRECAKLMIRRKYGRIISISSMMAVLAPMGGSIYSATKCALTQFSRIFAKEVASQNITCNVLGISAIETEMWNTLSKEKMNALLEGLPISRPATLDDITNVIDFFARKESANITGQVVYLNGAF